MRGGRRWWTGFALGLLALAAVAWFLPARWIVPRVEPRLHGIRLQQVQGSVWDGQAGQLLVSGRPLGQLHWRLSRRALLGKVRLRLALDGPALRFSGEVHRLAGGRMEWHDVRLKANLTALEAPPGTSLGRPLGTFELQVPYALLQASWPLQLQARGQWRDAAMRTERGSVTLGSLRFEAQGKQGMIRTQMHDDGTGPLALDGRLAFSPLGWQFAAALRSRSADPALQRWLAALGSPDAAGVVHLERHGGLAAAMLGNGAQR